MTRTVGVCSVNDVRRGTSEDRPALGRGVSDLCVGLKGPVSPFTPRLFPDLHRRKYTKRMYKIKFYFFFYSSTPCSSSDEGRRQGENEVLTPTGSTPLDEARTHGVGVDLCSRVRNKRSLDRLWS